MPSEDSKEIATEGQDRTGAYMVRKGHFVLVDNDTGPVVPSSHRLAWKQLTDEKIIFLVRDPRDICVSGAYHWRCTPAAFLERMIRGDVARCGRWDEYCDKWLDHNIWKVRYEDLSYNGLFAINNIVAILFYISGIDNFNRIEDALERQSFAVRSKGLSEQEMRRNNMRLGKVGDWRNHFTKEMNSRIWQEFGWMMERLEYAK